MSFPLHLARAGDRVAREPSLSARFARESILKITGLPPAVHSTAWRGPLRVRGKVGRRLEAEIEVRSKARLKEKPCKLALRVSGVKHAVHVAARLNLLSDQLDKLRTLRRFDRTAIETGVVGLH